ncbi:MAG: AAA family ATPase [Spirochaetales bacterium]|nr:AAA family ATPase [Spirochaetales bacterium]
MLRRKAYEDLLNWKKSKKGETLLIKGARQIGKTFLVREFGKNEYKSFIEINFLKNPSLKSIFDGELTAEEVYKRISAHLPDAELLKGETLIFLDEIQKCAKARTSLKFLAEDDSFDIICSGSLLGLHYGQDDDKEVEEVESVPVGFERQLIMYSMDFKEFLWAYGYKDKDIEYLKSFYDEKKKIPSDILKKFQSLIKEYIVVGGMPEVVNDFVTHKDFSRVQNIQEKILSSYDDDIANHARGAEKVKVRKCYDSVPRQLARENKKFKYSDVEKGSTSRKYADSVMWLQDSNLVHVCRNLYEPYLPLKANSKDSEFKLYYNDTGLLLARYGFQTKLAVLNNTILGNAKGGIYENLISEMLIKLGYSLHYYKTENSTMEIEFVIEKDGGTIPVEVKAGNSDTPSLNTFLEKFRSKYGIKLIDGNLGVSENKLVLPHFMAMFL